MTTSPSHMAWVEHRRQAQPLELSGGPTLVVAPHPDDEVLGCGGTIAALTARGDPVHVLAVTNGEASHPAVDPARLAALRRGEQRVALRLLGVAPQEIRRLGIADGEVEASEDALAGILTELAADYRRLIAPWIHDHHCDHEATGRAALAASRRTGTRLLGSLVWGWHRSNPARLNGSSLRYVRLDDAALDRRRRALSAHGTQLASDGGQGAVLTDEVVRSQRWQREYFVCR